MIYKNLPPADNYTHLSDYCRAPACVYGFIDHFDDNDCLVTTTICAVCKPNTYDYLQMFPNVGNRTHSVLQAMSSYRAKKISRRSDF